MEDNLFKVLLDPNNAIFYSILGTFIILAVIYFFYRYLIIPLKKKHLVEKNELEIKHISLMALIADMDPDPVLRINIHGIVKYTNRACSYLPEFLKMKEQNIWDLIKKKEIDIKELILNNTNYITSGVINEKYYIMHFRGNSELEIAHIYFHDYSDRKSYENRLKISRLKLKSLSHHLINSIEYERDRIAKELHDAIGQNMLFIKMKLQNDNIKDKSNLKGTIDLLENTIKEVRNIIYELKPKMLEDMGLEAAIRHLCEQISCDKSISYSVDIINIEQRLAKETEINVYRIIQELLNNIIKHSYAKNFSVQMIKIDSKIRLLVSDDGIGFDYNELKKNSSRLSGYGLSNLKERVSHMNGVFKIDTSHNHGTIVIAEIPVNKNEQ